MSLKDTLRVLATIGFTALKFNAGKKQFVASRKVPLEVSEQSEERPLAAKAVGAKAAVQIAG